MESISTSTSSFIHSSTTTLSSSYYELSNDQINTNLPKSFIPHVTSPNSCLTLEQANNCAIEGIFVIPTSIISHKQQLYESESTTDNTTKSNSFRNRLYEKKEVSQQKLEKLRALQESADRLEAEKESLVNQIYDLRQLLRKVNDEGEHKIEFIKNKNTLLRALETSRVNSQHFEEVSYYWSNIMSPCCATNEDDCSRDRSRDCGSATSSSRSQKCILSLTTMSSYQSAEKNNSSFNFFTDFTTQEAETEESEPHHHHSMLQPKLLNFKCGKGSMKQSKVESITQDVVASALLALHQ